MKMLARLKQIPSFLKGEFIVIRVDKDTDTLTVDAGRSTHKELQSVATTFFKKTYKLQRS